MPIYEVQGPDGSIYEIEGPAGASDDQVIGALKQHLSRQGAGGRRADPYGAMERLTKQKEGTDFIDTLENFGKGIGRGAVNVGELAGIGLVDAGGYQEENDRARAAIRELSGALRPEYDEGEEDTLSGKVGEAVGSIAGVAAPVALAAPMGLGALPTAIGAGVSSLMGAGEAGERARRAGLTGKEIEEQGIGTAGALVGATELLPVDRFFKFLGKPAVRDLKEMAKRAVTTGGLEGAQEAVSNVLQNAIERGYNPEADLLAGAGEEGALGAGVGGTIQIITDLLLGRKAASGYPELSDWEREFPSKGPQGQLPPPPPEQLEAPTPPPPPPTPMLGQDKRLGLPLIEGDEAESMDRIPELQAKAQERKAAIDKAALDTPNREKQQAETDLERAMEVRDRNLNRDKEQPDLFPMDLKQMGPQTERTPADNKVDTPRPVDPRQRDMIAEDEDLQLAEMEAADKAAAEKDTNLRKLAEEQNISSQREAQQRKTTEEGRYKILQDVIANNDSRDYTRAFSKALKDAGYRNTTPTVQERTTMYRAGKVATAKAPKPVKGPDVQAAPETTQNEAMEAAVAPKQQRQVEQPSFPGMGKPKGTQAAPEQAAPQQAPRTITEAMLDQMAIPKAAPIRKRTLGKDLNDPAVKQQFADFTQLPNASVAAKTNINRMLSEAPEAQMDLPLFGKPRTTKGKADGAKTNAGTVGTSTRDNGPDTVDGGAGGRGADTAPVESPVGGELGRGEQPTGRPRRRVARKPDTLKKGSRKAQAPKKPAPVKKEAPAKKPMSANTVLASDEKRSASQLIATVVDEKTGKERPRRETYEGKPLTQKDKVEIYHRELVLNEWQYDQALDPDAEYTGFFPMEAVTEGDLSTIVELERNPQTKKKEKLNPAKAARDYFISKVRAVDAMVDAAYDLINPKDQYKLRRAKLMKEWVNNNLSDHGKLLFAKLEAKFKRDLEIQAAADAARDKNVKKIDERILKERAMRRAAAQAEIDAALTEDARAELRKDQQTISDATIDDLFDTFYDSDPDILFNRREHSEKVDLSRDMHPAAVVKLAKGDLKGALEIIAETTVNKRVAHTARRLADKLGNTKVQIVSRAIDGDPNVSGAFLPYEDKILIHASDMSVHNLMHEVTHALTAKAIRQYPDSPSVKYMNQLYNKLKDKLGNEYGVTSLDEFIAEAFSNPEFQRKLAAFDPHGNLIPPKMPESMWTKFKQAVARLIRTVRGKGEPITNADQTMDTVIGAILTPQGGNFDLDTLYNEDGGIRDTSTIKEDYKPSMRTRLLSAWERIDRSARPAFLSTLPLNALADFMRARAPKEFSKFATKLDNIVRRQTGDLGKRMEENERVLKQYVHKWYKNASPEEHKRFNDIVADSTINEIDPTLDDAKAKEKYSADQYDKYLELKGRFNALSPAAKAAYQVMRNHYSKMYDEIVEVLGARLGQDDAGRRIFQEAMDIINKSGRIEPYFPLSRKGDYVVTYMDKNTGEVYHESFEYDAQRQEAIQELKRMGNISNIDQYIRSTSRDFKAAPPGSFVHQLNKVLANGGVKDDVRDQVMRLYMDSLPERSMLHGFRKRQGILGFDRNAVKVFEEKTNNFSHQISHMKFGNELMQLRGEVAEATRGKLGNDQEVAYFAEELNKRIDFAKNPTRSAWSRNVSSGIFHLTLGANISSALIQMAQIPIMIAPYLGPKYGYKNTIAAFEAARKLYMGNGFKQNSVMLDEHGKKRKVTERSMFGIDNYDFDDPNLPDDVKKYKTLVEVAKEHGQLHRSIVFDMLDVDAVKGTWNKVTQYSGMMMHQAERFNRHMALTAAYNLEVKAKEEKLGRNLTEAEQREAAMTAIDLVEFTNGSSQAAGAPRILQGDIGSVLGMYKRYGITMLYAQLRTLSQMSPKTEEGRTAIKQVLGMYGAAGAIAGLAGVPFYGVFATLADLFFTDDGEEDFDSMMRKQVGDWAFFGVPSNLLGVDLSSRIGMTDLIFRDPYRAYDKNALEIGVDMIGGPGVSIAKNLFGQVMTDVGDGNYWRAAEGALPASLRSGLKAIRYANEDARTRRGDLVAEMGGGDIVAQTLGFTPMEFSLKNKQNAIVGELNRVAGDDKRKLTKQLYVGMRMGDRGAVQDALQGIMEYNRRFPEMSITMDSIMKSLQSHQRTTGEMRNGLRIDQKLLPRVMQMESGYW